MWIFAAIFQNKKNFLTKFFEKIEDFKLKGNTYNWLLLENKAISNQKVIGKIEHNYINMKKLKLRDKNGGRVWPKQIWINS